MKLTPLAPGGTIGVMAPSSYVEAKDIEKSKALLEKRGYNVFIHPQTFERQHQSAGTHLQKTLALQGLWQRNDIDAIWAAGGGNRSMHLLDSINFNAMKRKPKLLIGFSDVTALLNAVTVHTGLPTIHGPLFKNIHACKHLDHLLDLLAGKKISYPWEKTKIVKKGKATGKLFGGNLSVFQYLPQTLSSEFYKDAIIFLEDCNEELSHIDRMLLHLKQLGVFNSAAAIIFGQFSDIRESGRPFGFTLDDIIAEHTENIETPVVMNAPFGHVQDFYSYPVGSEFTLDTAQKKITLKKSLFVK